MLSPFSHVRFAALWTLAHQAPLSMGEYWSGLPFPSPGDLPKPGIEPVSLTSLAWACRFFTTSTTWEAPASLVRVKVAQSNSCGPMDYIVHGTLQARILE